MASSYPRAPGASSSTMHPQEFTNQPTCSERQHLAQSQGPTPSRTPPKRKVVGSILEFIWAHQTTYQFDNPYSEEDFIVHITEEEEEELQAYGVKDPKLRYFVATQLRFRWCPPEIRSEKGLLTLRMTTHIHRRVALGLTNSINRQLFHVSEKVQAASDAAVTAASMIQSEGEYLCSFAVADDDMGVKGKIPDGAFSYNDDLIPSLIIEVGYTQNADDLYAKAASYLPRSQGKVRTSIAIKVQAQSPAERANNEPGSAAYVVFRWVNNSVDNIQPVPIMIRENGKAMDGSLDLRLADFCPKGVIFGDTDLDNPIISIPYSYLNSFIVRGHLQQRVKDNQRNLLPYVHNSPVRVTDFDHNPGDLPNNRRAKRAASSSDSDKDAESGTYARPAENSEGRLRKVARGGYAEAETSDTPDAEGDDTEVADVKASESSTGLSFPQDSEDEPQPAGPAPAGLEPAEPEPAEPPHAAKEPRRSSRSKWQPNYKY